MSTVFTNNLKRFTWFRTFLLTIWVYTRETWIWIALETYSGFSFGSLALSWVSGFEFVQRQNRLIPATRVQRSLFLTWSLLLSAAFSLFNSCSDIPSPTPDHTVTSQDSSLSTEILPCTYYRYIFVLDHYLHGMPEFMSIIGWWWVHEANHDVFEVVWKLLLQVTN